MRNTIVLEKDWTFYKNPQSESGEAVTLPHTWNAVDGRTAETIIIAEPANMCVILQNRNWKREEERIWNLTAQR